jgi:hypothetical protein
MRAFLQKHLDDLLIVPGCAALVYGVYLIYLPAAWIVGGVLLIGIGVALSLSMEVKP